METLDRSYPGGRSDTRRSRALRLDWSGLAGGTVLGWGALSLLTLLGAAVGFASVNPYAAHPAAGLDIGSGIWGGVEMLAAAFLGAYFVVRIAGDRRRGEALLHGGISWAISMGLGALLALGAARTAATNAAQIASGPRAQVKAAKEANMRSNLGGPTLAGRDRAADTANIAAKATGMAAGGAFLSLIAALFGALFAASTASGISISREFRLPGGKEKTANRVVAPNEPLRPRVDQQPIILPPTQH